MPLGDCDCDCDCTYIKITFLLKSAFSLIKIATKHSLITMYIIFNMFLDHKYKYYCDTHCLVLFLNKQHREVQSLFGLCIYLQIILKCYVAIAIASASASASNICKCVNVGL